MRSNAFDEISSFIVNDRNGSSLLDDTDKKLAQIGCLLALNPASAYLKTIFEDAIDIGISIQLLEAAIIHSLGYVGLGNASIANGTLQTVIKNAGKEGECLAVPVISANTGERIKQGYEFYGRFDASRAPEQEKIYQTIADFYYPRAMEFAGLVLNETAISLRQRQVVTIAMLSCLDIGPQLKFHTGVALQNNVSRNQVAAILLYVQFYAGLARANTAAMIIREVFLNS